MAGILDSKQRLIDTIITQEGRRQVAAGELQIKFVTFTDAHAFYKGNVSNVATGAGDRLYFEAAGRPQDQIIFETNNVGELVPFTGGDIEFSGNKIFKPLNATGSMGQYLQVVTGSDVISQADKLLRNSYNNFRDQYIIGTKDIFDETNAFEITPTAMTFKITDEVPFAENEISKASIDDVESLFQDVRLAHLPNYRFLPPTNIKSPGTTMGTPLGSYKNMNQSEMLTFEDLMSSLDDKESVTIKFTETSNDNNIIAQMLDVRPDHAEKLVTIDFGEFPDEDPYSPGKRVFFLGKIFSDGFGNFTFVNIFTVIFD